jgi:molybdenum cofactor cytidylyltransferase
MIFLRIPVAGAEGAILGHSLKAGGRSLPKGHVLSAADIALLQAAAIPTVVVARLEAGDVAEDAAASALAAALAGDGVKRQAAFTGRCNLYAAENGVAVVDRSAIESLNLIDEAITVATLAPFAPVEPGQLLATVKVIPFAAPRASLDRCCAIAARGRLRVAAFAPHDAGLVLTRLPQTKPGVIDKTLAVTEARLEALGSRLAASAVCGHDAGEVAAAVAGLLDRGLDPLLICGATAIVDRRDAIPAGIVAAGGTIDHFGMPVDPGNLLLLAHRGDAAIICLPGCARSPKVNGFDFVLQRVLAGLAVSAAEFAAMGVGGLLSEIPSRPLPREGGVSEAPRAPRVAGVILAAGRSSRMGSNKLLEPVGGRPMILHAVDAVLASAARPVIVVTGHQAEDIRRAVAGHEVTLVHNAAYEEGMSTSLRAGIAALPKECEGALVCLGDMPGIRAGHIESLIAAFNPAESRSIIVPVHGGRRGHPVLWAARFFAEMASIKGDVGARHLIGEHADEVREVTIDDPSVLLDVDTPEALADLRAAT